MYCTKCGAKNEDDHKFCSECGAKLTATNTQTQEAEAERAQEPVIDHEKVGNLLFNAFQQYERGDLDGALESCREALKINPSSTSVHSLLSLIHEKRGEIELAINEVERVLGLNPDSAADQERLEQLRKKYYSDSDTKSFWETSAENIKKAPRGFLSVVIVFSMAVFLFAAFYPRTQIPKQPTTREPLAENQQTTVPVQPVQPQQAPQYQQYPQYPQPQFQQYPPQVASAPQPPSPARQEPHDEEALPHAGSARPVGAAANPQPFPEIKIEPSKPKQEQQQTQTAPATPAAQPPKNVPKINIITTPAKPKPPADTATAQRLASSTYLEQARNAQLSGNYEEAIQNYRRALEGSDNPGPIYQQIAISYQRLGKKEEAIANYQSAIDAYKKQISENKNAEEARRGLAAAEAGLRLLQGR